MNYLKIYFVTNKSVSPSPQIDSLMKEEITLAYKTDKRNYLATTIEALNNSPQINSFVDDLVTKEPIIYNEIDFKADIKVVEDPNNMFREIPSHSYKLNLTLKSIEYTCVKIFDESQYLCFNTDNNELKVIKKTKDSKVYVAG